jgi:hypothetical protein
VRERKGREDEEKKGGDKERERGRVLERERESEREESDIAPSFFHLLHFIQIL